MIHKTAFIHARTIVEPGVHVSAHTRIWAFAHVLPGARIGCNCNICDHVFIENQVIVKAKTMTQCPHDDYDTPWKEALERYLPDFLALLFPDVHAGIDWSRGYEFLDKELQQVVRDAELGRRLADKLVQVVDIEGQEDWLLIHVEIQGRSESAFAQRLFVYNYRIYDRYRRPVVSLAVLADEREDWRPDRFSYRRWGCEVGIRYPLAKLLDYRSRSSFRRISRPGKPAMRPMTGTRQN